MHNSKIKIMKITNLQNGNIIIEFNKEEISIINESKSEIKENIDPFKGMQNHTKSFAKELYFNYGNKEFSAKDEKVIQLRRKYFISDMVPALRNLIKKKHINISYTQSNSITGKRLNKLKFNL
jgi:sulfur relay (sulfurtransferase) DsrC/TusE family protein